MFARDVEMFIEYCENKGLATKTIGSYEQTLRLLMLWLDEKVSHRLKNHPCSHSRLCKTNKGTWKVHGHQQPE